MTYPDNPIDAVTHLNPYPYYAELVAHEPIYRDEALGLWVASSAAAVNAALHSELCRVRPPAEPVLKALLGSPAAEIFRHLVRMNDGVAHCPFKLAIAATLESIAASEVSEPSQHWARFLANGLSPVEHTARLSNFAFQLPVYVVASLLGVPQAMLAQTALSISDFVRCLAPSATAQQLEQGKLAAASLLQTFHALLSGNADGTTDGLLGVLATEGRRVGRDDRDIIVANAIGFLMQAYEATAGLIGNTLIALAQHDAMRAQVMASPGLLNHVIDEVLRYDPPIQNTRRFLASDGIVAGQAMAAGDAILLVLAAANRDPSVNPDPAQFDITRTNRRSFTFGAGSHACPGATVAAIIAQAGVAQLIASGLDLDRLRNTASFRPSANARIRLFS